MDQMSFKLLHLVGVMLLFFVVGRFALNSQITKKMRFFHGLGLGMILIGGVMMVYHMGLDGADGVPLWIKLKLGCLIGLGGTVLIAKNKATSRFLLPVSIFFGFVATYLALYQPF